MSLLSCRPSGLYFLRCLCCRDFVAGRVFPFCHTLLSCRLPLRPPQETEILPRLNPTTTRLLHIHTCTPLNIYDRDCFLCLRCMSCAFRVQVTLPLFIAVFVRASDPSSFYSTSHTSPVLYVVHPPSPRPFYLAFITEASFVYFRCVSCALMGTSHIVSFITAFAHTSDPHLLQHKPHNLSSVHGLPALPAT